MKKEFYIELIYKSLSSEISVEEQTQLDVWLRADAENQKTATAIEKLWKMSANFSKEIKVDLDKDFAQLEQRIQADEKGSKPKAITRTLPQQTKKSWWKLLSIAAAILLLAGAFFILNKNKDTAQMLAMQTLSGEIKEIALADGSKIWLNQNSKLDYPDQMNGNERRVTLTGEAFFDISKNPQKPFIITTRDAEVKVLGTSFQVRAYDEESQTEVVVKTGKVSLEKKSGGKSIILTPNQKGIYDSKIDKYSRGEVQNLNVISWQNKMLDFRDTPLWKVLEDVENHFDIKLMLVNQDLRKCPFDNISHQPKQAEVLKAIGDVFKLKLVKVGEKEFRLEGGVCP